MLISAVRKYKKMILASIFCFYLGCGLTLSLLRIDCADAFTEKPKEPVQNEISISNALDKVEYAVLILVGPDYEKERDTIRTTWANLVNNIIVENGERIYRWNQTWSGRYTAKDFIKIYFVVGTKGLNEVKKIKLKDEHSRTKDLLLIDNIKDAYTNLTEKLLVALKWLNNNLNNLHYVVKCDHDSFVRIDLIIRDLDAFAPTMDDTEISSYVTMKSKEATYKGLYWGYMDGRAHVYQSGKWQEHDWFLCDHFLPYALGGGYVMSQSIVKFVANNAEFLSTYTSEDASMGVWTAPLANINRVHDIRFDTQWKSRGCQNSMLIRHKQTASDMFSMYTSLVSSQGKNLCRTESIEMKTYFYKWDVPPSMCCKAN